MKPIVTAALAIGAFGSAFAVIMFWPGGQKCDARDVLATVESMANDRLRNYDAMDFLLRSGGSGVDKDNINKLVRIGDPIHFAFDSFRERGWEGKGLRCAAMVYALLGTKRTFEFSTEYSIEPTSDGKTIVSARFTPN
jgi:hypothetical protein